LPRHLRAKSWELRPANSLAGLQRTEGRYVEARDPLSPIIFKHHNHWGLLTLVAIATLPAVSSAETKRETITVPAASEPASQDQPPCSGVNPMTIGDEVVSRLGDELDNYTGESIGGDVVRDPKNSSWIKERLGLNNGRSACKTICFVVPTAATVTAEVNVAARTSWSCPKPGCLPTDQYYNNNLGIWAGNPGPSSSARGNNNVLCWTAMNWSHDQERVFEITVHY
jgi:hypothetical protein